MAPLSSYASHQNDYIGIALPQYGWVVYPQVVELPWGDNSKTYYNIGVNSYADTALKGKEATYHCYNDSGSTSNPSNANKATSCAIGYAANFERFVGDRGIGRGNWFMAAPQEFIQKLLPYWNRLVYAASLFGFTWPAQFWTGVDALYPGQSAFKFNPSTNDTLGRAKTDSLGVLLIAEMTVTLEQKTT